MNREAERQRLVKLLYDGKLIHNLLDNDARAHYLIMKLTDYLLDNVVIVPPCKVGDTIYFIGGINNRIIYDVTVEEIYFGDTYAFNVSRGNANFTLLQREVYFTREEAEAKLGGKEDV